MRVFAARRPHDPCIAGALVLAFFALTGSLLVTESLVAQSRPRVEALFYMTSSERSVQSFLRHADRISIVGPQVYSVKEDGVVWGQVDPRVIETAREKGVKVMPLIVNPGFDREMFHKLLMDPKARARTIAAMVDLAKEFGYWGWQFDFEHIHVSDRDALTVFYREAADALHANGLTLSVAAVPTTGKISATPYQWFMEADWRGSFDLKAMAEAGDFISLMTYDQHSRNTPPGPVAGLPWVRDMVDYALSQGVPPEKLSLGIPSYSHYWYATHTAERGIHAYGRQLDYETASGLLDKYDAKTTWMPEQGVSWAVWDNRSQWEYLFLENRRAFEAKLDLLKEYPGLHGISVWVLGSEDPEIWEAVRGRLEVKR